MEKWCVDSESHSLVMIAFRLACNSYETKRERERESKPDAEFSAFNIFHFWETDSVTCSNINEFSLEPPHKLWTPCSVLSKCFCRLALVTMVELCVGGSPKSTCFFIMAISMNELFCAWMSPVASAPPRQQVIKVLSHIAWRFSVHFYWKATQNIQPMPLHFSTSFTGSKHRILPIKYAGVGQLDFLPVCWLVKRELAVVITS